MITDLFLNNPRRGGATSNNLHKLDPDFEIIEIVNPLTPPTEKRRPGIRANLRKGNLERKHVAFPLVGFFSQWNQWVRDLDGFKIQGRLKLCALFSVAAPRPGLSRNSHYTLRAIAPTSHRTLIPRRVILHQLRGRGSGGLQGIGNCEREEALVCHLQSPILTSSL